MTTGLSLFGSALLWLFSIAVLGSLTLLLSFAIKSDNLAKALVFSFPFVALVTGIIMQIGIGRFCKQPDDSPAFVSAAFGFVLLLLSLCLHANVCVALTRALAALTFDKAEYGAATLRVYAAVDVWHWAFVFTSVSLLCLVASMRSLSIAMGKPGLVRSSLNTGGLLTCSACVFLVLRLWPELTSVPLVVAFILLYFVSVCMCLSLVGRVVAAMEVHEPRYIAAKARALEV
jgi:hypothetical protein